MGKGGAGQKGRGRGGEEEEEKGRERGALPCSGKARHICVGGFACAIQLHREVKPESGLSTYEIYDMKACRITTLF